MQETLARLPKFNAIGNANAGQRLADERFRDDRSVERVVSPIERTFEERCAAIDRVFAHDADALVENFIRRQGGASA